MDAVKPDNNMQVKKRPIDDRVGNQGLNSSRDGSESPLPENSTMVREDDEADSPQLFSQSRENGSHKYPKIHSYPSAMDTDSPASFPKHVIVPSPPDSNDQRHHPLVPRPSGVDYMDDSPVRKKTDEKVVTPILAHESRHHGQGSYNVPTYRPQGGGYPPRGGDGYGYGYYHNHSEIDTVQHYGHEQKIHQHPKYWVCDYCHSATFNSYEDACSHEDACSARYGVMQRQRPYPTTSPHAYPNRQPTGGLGTLYQASQEVHHFSPRMPPPPPHHDSYHHHTAPRPPHRYPPSGWGAAPKWIPSERAGYPTLSPRFHDYRIYDDHHDMGQHHRPPTNNSSSHSINSNNNSHNNYQQYEQPRLLLALPGDADSLSDRQCYVRSKFVEIFAATEKDVASRHSKGAQKLTLGQVGIRCIHCAHLRSKDRAERAICYPSSISRIYQTVADMQRFHFEHCQEIPDAVRKIYKSLKTTRPRGVGSPQTYWIQSAKQLNLVDSDEGIFFGTGNNNTQHESM